MKKLLSVTLATIMLLSVFSVAVFAAVTQATAPANDGSVLFYTAGSASDIRTEDSDRTSVSIITQGTKKLIEKKRTAETGVFSLFVEPAELKNASNTHWFEFWMDISEYCPDETYFFNFRMFDAAGAVCDTYGGGNYIAFKILVNGAWEERVVDTYGRASLPAGFAGYIRFDMKTLIESVSPYAGNGNEIDPRYIQTFGIWSDHAPLGANGIGKSIYYNDFKFVKDNSKDPGGNVDDGPEAPAPTQPDLPSITGSAVNFVKGDTDATLEGVNQNVQEVSSVASGSKTLIKIKSLRSGGEPGFKFTLDSAVDASGKKYLEFWIDSSIATEEVALNLGMRIADSNGAVADIYGASGVVDYWLQENGTWNKYTVADSRCPIPVNYTGYVRINMNQFKNCKTEYIGNGNKLDVSKIIGMWFWYNTSEEQVNKSVYVNDFRFVNDDALVSPDTGSDFLAVSALMCVALITAGCVFGKKRYNKI